MMVKDSVAPFIILVIFIGGTYGYINNIVQIFNNDATFMRVAGIFFPPLGAVMGVI